MWTVIEPAALFNVSLLPLKPPTDILAGFLFPCFCVVCLDCAYSSSSKRWSGLKLLPYMWWLLSCQLQYSKSNDRNKCRTYTIQANCCVFGRDNRRFTMRNVALLCQRKKKRKITLYYLVNINSVFFPETPHRLVFLLKPVNLIHFVHWQYKYNPNKYQLLWHYIWICWNRQ